MTGFGKPGPIAAANGTVVYAWSETSDAGGFGAVASTIASVPRGGGTPTTLATSDRAVVSIVLDATNAWDILDAFNGVKALFVTDR